MNQWESSGAQLNRRGLLTAAASLVAVASPAVAAGAPSGRDPETFGPAPVRPGDPRYESLLRGDNHRFCGRPGGTSRPHARP
ncbi:hypothetical protein ACFYST_20900 [Kitasatospora sp. NPDC004614]|uniref:hypothetical protein n=1 Tax=unclassified Kitasatospora TaxID=2633591 RepID=UPI0036AF2B86